MIARADSVSASHEPAIRLSYKFQRLREQLRQSILSGQFSGRLPGERELGKRFAANAKTINKALCDLASEGLVVRHIGKGTFVAAPAVGTPTIHRRRVAHWVFSAADAPSADSTLPRLVEQALVGAGHQLVRRAIDAPLGVPLNPSNTFFRGDDPIDAVMIFPPLPLTRPEAGLPADDFLLSLARRQVPTIFLGSSCESFKRHSVVPDYSDAGFVVAEFLLKTDCRHLVCAVVAPDGAEVRAALTGVQTAAARRGAKCEMVVVPADGTVGPLPSHENMGVICIGADALRGVQPQLAARKVRVPLVAVLEPGNDAARQAELTAYEFDPRRLAEWVMKLILDARPGSPPIHVLVPGELQIRGTTSKVVSRPPREPLPAAVV